MPDKLKIGDRIKFRAVTRWSARTVWRTINGFWLGDTSPTVRFGGWDNFIVNRSDIIAVQPA